MKKIVLTAATIAALSSTTALAHEDSFYVKANVGMAKLSSMGSLKSSNDIFFGAGVGYYLMDNVRFDLTFDHYANPTYKATVNNVTNKLKANADSLLLNGFVDLADLGIATVFAGAGVGVSMLKGTLTEGIKSVSAKKSTGFAYAGYLGASSELDHGIHAELTYSYRDVGKIKNLPQVKVKGHHIAAGVRFDI